MSRRQARQTAFEILFQIDLAKSETNSAIIDRTEKLALDQVDSIYTRDLVEGVRKNIEELDAIISKYSKDWKIERLPFVDKNILRLAIYELKYVASVPLKVSVNEAVELAKTFGDDKSSKFINGILGSVVNELEVVGDS